MYAFFGMDKSRGVSCILLPSGISGDITLGGILLIQLGGDGSLLKELLEPWNLNTLFINLITCVGCC